MDIEREWKLIRELGIERNDAAAAHSSHLFKPVAALPLARPEEILILDRFPGRSRVLILHDSNLSEFSISRLLCPSGYIRSIVPADDRGFLVVAGNTPREIVLVDRYGSVLRQIYSSGGVHPLKWPGFALAIGGQILVGDQPVTCDGVRIPAGLVLLDYAGNVLWQWRPGDPILADVSHIAVAPRRGMVVTDPEAHQVLMIGWDKKILWRFGERGIPGCDNEHLSSPSCTTRTPSGTFVVTDTRNDRLVELTPNGKFLRLIGSARDEEGARLGPFCDPGFASESENGIILVADTGNSRLFAIDRKGKIHWIFGQKSVPRRLLSYPRSIEKLSNKRWLVADANNDRVIELGDDNRVLWQYGRGLPHPGCTLHWPRCARRYRDGSTIIADSMNGRILVVGRNGEHLKEFREVSLPSKKKVEFRDPHDILPIKGGNLLVVDSALGLLIELNMEGEVNWVLGDPETDDALYDPHQVVAISPSRLLLVDNTGIVTVAYRGHILDRTKSLVSCAGTSIELTRPKALLNTKRALFIADPYESRHDFVLLDKRHGVSHEILGMNRNEQRPTASDLYSLHQPRWLTLSRDKHLMISDYSGHRLIEISPA